MSRAATPRRRSAEIQAELGRLLGPGMVGPATAAHLTDATEHRGIAGSADAVALPTTTEEVAGVVAWCYETRCRSCRGAAATGFAGGAVPLDGGVVLGLERMARVRAFDPLLWRTCVEAGLPTAEIRRLARENGLLFPPDPGAAEQSQIGGNIATNAGGPHAFKYGVTGAWVTGLEAVVPPGQIVAIGGAIRKDVAGYDPKSLLIGSEGTLGVITAAWLRLLPAPEAKLARGRLPRERRGGLPGDRGGAGRRAERGRTRVSGRWRLGRGRRFPSGGWTAAENAGFMVIAEADGTKAEAERGRRELVEALGAGALSVGAPAGRREVEALWRWRDGVSIAIEARRGGKVSEDIVVPLDRLREAIEETVAIGGRHRLEACSWGHAGDGNLHSTFLVAPSDVGGWSGRVGQRGAIRARGAVGRIDLGRARHRLGQAGAAGAPMAVAGARAARGGQARFDPKGLLNPGKKIATL